MSAAAEYYGWLLRQGYGETQLKKFESHARRANRGEISHNKAYRLACRDGFKGYSNANDKALSDNVGGSDKGSFGDWMDTAKNAGWIDRGNKPADKENFKVEVNPNKDKSKTMFYVVAGLAIAGIMTAIYLRNKNK